MNNTDKIEKLLTESAKEKISEIIADKKQELLEKAFDIARQNQTENIEISLRDILEANDSNRYTELKIKNSASRRKRMTYLIGLAGALYAIIGFMIYFYQTSNFDLKSDLGLIMVVAGILMTFLSFFFNQFYLLKQSKLQTEVKVKNHDFYPSPDYAVVERWQIIESLVRKKYAKNEKEQKVISFNQLLQYLSEHYATSDKDLKEIKQLLTARNDIVHDSQKYSDSKRAEMIIIADKIIEKLEKS